VTATTAELRWNPYDRSQDEDAHQLWKQMRDQRPFYYNEELDFYALSRHADVKSALLNWQAFSSAQGVILDLMKNPGAVAQVRNMLFEDPPEHDMHRGTIAGVFTPRRVAALEPAITDRCAQLLDRLSGDGFDIVTGFADRLPTAVIGALLGARPEEYDTIVDLSNAYLVRDNIEAGMRARLELREYFRDLVEEQRESPTDSFLGDLVQVRVKEGGDERLLTIDEMLNQVNVLALAGNETTNRFIGWSVLTLARHPEQRTELVAGPALLKEAFEELLPFEPPTVYTGRTTTRAVEVSGETIPAGAHVLLINMSASRDERVFNDPDRLDIHRKTAANQVGFGAGPHYCLGAALARLEGRVALREILSRWPEWDIDLDRSVRFPSAMVRGWSNLWVVPR
jgi:cytochrome P450